MKSVRLKKDWGRFESGALIEVDNVRAKALIESEMAEIATAKSLKKFKKKQDGERFSI